MTDTEKRTLTPMKPAYLLLVPALAGAAASSLVNAAPFGGGSGPPSNPPPAYNSYSAQQQANDAIRRQQQADEEIRENQERLNQQRQQQQEKAREQQQEAQQRQAANNARWQQNNANAYQAGQGNTTGHSLGQATDNDPGGSVHPEGSTVSPDSGSSGASGSPNASLDTDSSDNAGSGPSAPVGLPGVGKLSDVTVPNAASLGYSSSSASVGAPLEWTFPPAIPGVVRWVNGQPIDNDGFIVEGVTVDANGNAAISGMSPEELAAWQKGNTDYWHHQENVMNAAVTAFQKAHDAWYEDHRLGFASYADEPIERNYTSEATAELGLYEPDQPAREKPVDDTFLQSMQNAAEKFADEDAKAKENGKDTATTLTDPNKAINWLKNAKFDDDSDK